MDSRPGGKQADESPDRFLRLDLPPHFELDFASEKATSGWLTVPGPLRSEWFVRINDGSFVCSGHGGEPITLRASKLLGGGLIEAVDDLGREVTYRIRPVETPEPEAVESTELGGSDLVITATGRVVDLHAPDPQMICVDDIAAALAKSFRDVPRYSNSYSAAQRALLATEIICGPLERPELAFTTLHHTSHEAFCFGSETSVLARPATSGFLQAERIRDALRAAIAEAFEIQPASKVPVEDARLVEQAHAIALAMESQRLTPDAFQMARQSLCLEPEETQLVPHLPRPMEPRQAELAFLRLHGRLVG